MLSNWFVGLDVNSHLFLLAFFYLTDQSESDQYLRVVVERWFQIFAATSILNICCYLQTVSFISRLFVVESLDVCMNEFQQPIVPSWKADPKKDRAVQKSLQKPTHLHWTLLYNWKIIDSCFRIYTVHTYTPGVCIFSWMSIFNTWCMSLFHICSFHACPVEGYFIW